MYVNFKYSFFNLKGIDEPLTKLTSKSAMMRNGWNVDVDYSIGEDPHEGKEHSCKSGQFYGYKKRYGMGSVSAIFKGSGKANLKFTNCLRADGWVTVSLNGVEIDRSEEKIEIVSFRYEKGDFLEIQEFNAASIELYFLVLLDGGNFAYRF